MLKNLALATLVLSLAACGPDPLPTGVPSGNDSGNVATGHVLVAGDKVYTDKAALCGYGLQDHEIYTVLDVNWKTGMVKVEQTPVGSGRTFSAPLNCFSGQ